MSKPIRRAAAAALSGALALLLVGCSATVRGVAVMATQGTGGDGANVALMDTGRYSTTPGHPVGTAGSEAAGAVLEAQRMAEYVVGPWEVNAKLRRPDFLGIKATPDLQFLKDVLPQPVPDVASAHGLITAFATSRTSTDSQVPLALTNVVMRFPDAGAAAAAAGEMSAKTGDLKDPPRSAITLHDEPDATAWIHDYLDDQVAIDSFTVHGPFVLYQRARSQKSSFPDIEPDAATSIELILTRQIALITQFTPTDPAKLADLPLDPTGKLLARTLATSEADATFVVGVWQPRAWLHFEDDPIAATAWYAAAGVEVVAKGLTTVYQTADAGGAARVEERETGDPNFPASTNTRVRGLTAARCGKRQGVSAAPTIHEMAARYRCVAAAERYAYLAYSDTEVDVEQQTAAQYRILAGK